MTGPREGFNAALDAVIDRAADRAAEQFMCGVGFAAGLPTLHWSLMSRRDDALLGSVSSAEGSDRDRAAALEAWAEFLGLERVGDSSPGSAEYGGVVDGRTVRLYGLVDRAAFDAYHAERKRGAGK